MVPVPSLLPNCDGHDLGWIMSAAVEGVERADVILVMLTKLAVLAILARSLADIVEGRGWDPLSLAAI